MTRIYLDAPLTVGQDTELPETAVRHLVQVLRMQAGAAFVAFDGRGGEYRAELVSVAKKHAVARITAHDATERESPLDLRLAQCVSKGDRMDYSLQKAVELGVTHIIPIVSERSVVRMDEDRWEKKREHWQGVIVSACEQSGRTRVPTLDAATPLARWLASGAAGFGVTLDPTASQSLHGLPFSSGSMSLLVGPEGGLSERELIEARQAGFHGVRMGPRILRTETAGVAALAALQAMYGDWR